MASSSSAQAPSDVGGEGVASQIPFHDLCSLMEKVHKTQGTDRKKKILSSFIDRWRETHARLHPTDAATTVGGGGGRGLWGWGVGAGGLGGGGWGVWGVGAGGLGVGGQGEGGGRWVGGRKHTGSVCLDIFIQDLADRTLRQFKF